MIVVKLGTIQELRGLGGYTDRACVAACNDNRRAGRAMFTDNNGQLELAIADVDRCLARVLPDFFWRTFDLADDAVAFFLELGQSGFRPGIAEDVDLASATIAAGELATRGRTGRIARVL